MLTRMGLTYMDVEHQIVRDRWHLQLEILFE